jgi:hypothetical protein
LSDSLKTALKTQAMQPKFFSTNLLVVNK